MEFAATRRSGPKDSQSDMIPPGSYAEWARCFDELRNGLDDEAVLAAMEKGTLSWSSGVAERFTVQLFEAINSRIDGASKKLQRNMDMARGNETAIVNSLLGMKREMKFLKKLPALPAIPEDKRDCFSRQLSDYVRNTQECLEKSAKSDRSGRLGTLIRNNRIDALE